MVDVFISYSRTNQPLVRQLAEAVQRLGYRVWWDDELPPHLSYGDVITQKIGEAKAAIVVWSEDAAASEWVRAEADVARNQKKLIQTSIDGRMPPMPFNQIQFASIGDWRGEDDHPGWRKVRESLAALCGAAGAPGGPRLAFTPLAAPPPVSVAAPPRPRRGLFALAAVFALLAVLVVGYAILASRRGAPSVANAVATPPAVVPAAPAEPEPTVPIRTDQQFTEAATVDAPTGSAELRSGPSAGSFLVGHVNRGTLVTTYAQQGDWWQVRGPDGTVGYVPHDQLRLLSTAAAPESAPRPAAEPPRPRPEPQAAAEPAAQRYPQRRPPPPQTRAYNDGFPPGVINPRRYCKGPGRGTPPCRGFRDAY